VIVAFPGGSHPTVSGSDDACYLEVTREVFYPAPVDWHFASLVLFATIVVGVMTTWLWIKYRREGRRY